MTERAIPSRAAMTVELWQPICRPHYRGLIRFANPHDEMELWFVFDTSSDARTLYVRRATFRDRLAWKLGRGWHRTLYWAQDRWEALAEWLGRSEDTP